MEGPLLNDAGEYPADQVLAKHLGKNKPLWDAFAGRAGAEVPGASLEWRYYNDGKAWLCKLVRKKKTVCWLSVWDGFFKTTFYFTARTDAGIEALPIPSELKASYRTRKPLGKLMPMTVEVKNRQSLDAVFALVEYKCSLK